MTTPTPNTPADPANIVAHLRNVHGWNDHSIAQLADTGRTPHQGHTDEHTSGAPLSHFHGQVTATIDPQTWINDQAVSVDPPGPVSWDATKHARQHADYLQQLLDNDTHGQFHNPDVGLIDNDDRFFDDPNAPTWITDWDGPFTITLHNTPPQPEGSSELPDIDELPNGPIQWLAQQVLAAIEHGGMHPEDALTEVIWPLTNTDDQWLTQTWLACKDRNLGHLYDPDATRQADMQDTIVGNVQAHLDQHHPSWNTTDVDSDTSDSWPTIEVDQHMFEMLRPAANNLLDTSVRNLIDVTFTISDNQQIEHVAVGITHNNQDINEYLYEPEQAHQLLPVAHAAGVDLTQPGEHHIQLHHPTSDTTTTDAEQDTPAADDTNEPDSNSEWTPTQRQIAIEHVQVLCNTSKRQAATIVDTRNFDRPVDGHHDLLQHVITAAVEGNGHDPRAVAAMLRAMGHTETDYDPTQGAVYFGHMPDRYCWTGNNQVRHLGHGHTTTVTIPDANPRRAAKTLAKLLTQPNS